MKILVGIILTIVLAGGLVLFISTSDKDGDGDVDTVNVSNGDNSQDVDTGDSVDFGDTKAACEVFTASIAEQVIGAIATSDDLPPGANASTDDVSVSNCIFDDGTASLDSTVASVLVRAAKSSSGASTNGFGFESTKEAAATAIAGVGDQAYWNPEFGQTNALVEGGKYWVIASVSRGLNSFDMAASQQLLELVVAEL